MSKFSRFRPNNLKINIENSNLSTNPTKTNSSKFSSPQNKSGKFINNDNKNSSGRKENHTNNIFSIQEKEEKNKYILFAIILESVIFQIIINFFTIFALFADDFRILALPNSGDDIFDAFIILCIVIFLIEIFLSVFVKINYNFSFFFWLDIISTVTLIFDLQSVNKNLFSNEFFNNY